MIRQTFGWFPDTASEATETPAVNVTKFGDGYEARLADTVNVNRQSWKVTFTTGRKSGNGLAIRAFLQARGGKDAFIWINPFGETGLYVARTWTSKSDRGEISIASVFDEVFEGE
jgi:phage-related protein